MGVDAMAMMSWHGGRPRGTGNIRIMLTDVELRRKVMGCWLGKAVGGTLGMPYEGTRDTLDLTYYDPVPTTMLPNDDLDLQVVYAVLMDKMDPVRVEREALTAAWQHIGMSPDEYGVCKRNLELGLRPPATGSYDNPFVNGMGAAIRTELWASLAPGRPEVAVQYAYEDACMDHAEEGIYAARFLAALESLAFVESNREQLLDRASAFLPATSSVLVAINDTRAWWAASRDWRQVQRKLVDRYLTDNFTDVTLNLAFIVLGWLASEGDFGRAICVAVNCGQDTDCTGATLGALLGIIDPDGIDAKWLTPIGENLILSPSVSGIDHPATLSQFTELVESLRHRLEGRPPSAKTVEQSVDHLAIRAEVGFSDPVDVDQSRDLPPMPGNRREVTFPGSMARWPANGWEGRALHVRYRVWMDRARSMRLVFNTREPVRVWLDGRFAFGRDGGCFVPAVHRAPSDQTVVIDVGKGWHEVNAVIPQPEPARDIEWYVDVAEAVDPAVCSQWIANAFVRVGT
jgi:ADP-ribosylglycohydrolase